METSNDPVVFNYINQYTIENIKHKELCDCTVNEVYTYYIYKQALEVEKTISECSCDTYDDLYQVVEDVKAEMSTCSHGTYPECNECYQNVIEYLTLLGYYY